MTIEELVVKFSSRLRSIDDVKDLEKDILELIHKGPEFVTLMRGHYDRLEHPPIYPQEERAAWDEYFAVQSKEVGPDLGAKRADAMLVERKKRFS